MENGWINIFSFLVSMLYFSKLNSQNNLILNGSFEDWNNKYPTHWIVANSNPSFFKLDQQFQEYITNTDNKKLRSKFLKSGSQGISYVCVGEDEVVEGQLKEYLQKDTVYTFSFYVNKLLMGSQEKFYNITIRISSDQLKKINTPREVKDYIVITLNNIDSIYKHKWTLISFNYKAKGGEKYFQIGAFGDIYPKLIYSLNHLCYDDFLLNKKSDSYDSLIYSIGKFRIENEHKTKINSIMKNAINYNYIEIESYASKIGDSIKNAHIAKKRMEEVDNYIQNTRITKTKLASYGDKFSPKGKEEFQKVTLKLKRNGFSDFSPTFNIGLQNELKKIIDDDQKIRSEINELRDTLRRASVNNLKYIDSINIMKIDSIIKIYGYPGISLVGADLMDVAFWTIQHSKYEVRDRLKELVINAGNRCEFNYSLLPMFIDRNLLDEGKPQLYGTQFYFDKSVSKYLPFKIDNEAEVNKRRKLFKLSTLEKYIAEMND